MHELPPHEMFYCFPSSKEHLINLGRQRPGVIAHVEFHRRGAGIVSYSVECIRHALRWQGSLTFATTVG